MDGSYRTEKKQPGKFWLGLLSLVGWAIDTGLVTLIYCLVILQHAVLRDDFSSIVIQWSIIWGIVMVVIWLPVAIIAGFRSRKKGFKAALTIVLITSIVAPILTSCGCFMLIFLLGRLFG